MPKSFIWIFIFIMGALVSCNKESTQAKFVPIEAIAKAESAHPLTSASTATPVVATVNGEAILLADLQNQIQKSQTSLIRFNLNNPNQTEQQVLEQLIDKKIIEQAARLQGIEIDDTSLNQEILNLKQGYSPEAFSAWLELNNYTVAEFEQNYRTELIAARFFADISEQIPTFAEQIHARQIVVSDYNLAQTIVEQLQAGESFSYLAQSYSDDEQSRIYGGDLGWFPKNINKLPQEVEPTAFALSTGETSDIIQVGQAYYLIKVELKEQNRALTPQHRQSLQQYMFKSWLAQQRTSATIEHYTQ